MRTPVVSTVAFVCALAAVSCAPSTVTSGPTPTSLCAARSTATVVPSARTPLPSGEQLADLVRQFEYDATARLDACEVSQSQDGTVRIVDRELASPKGGRARVTLLVPSGSRRPPAMLFIGGANERRGRTQVDALPYAQAGIVALILEQSQRSAGRADYPTFTVQDREDMIQTIVDARRALDLLVDVDPDRIGYYGLSYGAFLGPMLGAADPRPSTFVLRSGAGQDLTHLASILGRPASSQEYITTMRSVDQVRYAPALARSAVLVQNGLRDDTFSPAAIKSWKSAFSGAEVREYDTGHALTDPSSRAEALSWVRKRWGLGG